MRTVIYQDITLCQFKAGDDWVAFTTHLSLRAPLDGLLSVIDNILDNKPDVVFVEELDWVNAVQAYQEEHYPDL